MSVQIARSGSLSEKRLNGIYWKTFVGFVNKNNGNTDTSEDDDVHDRHRSNRIEKREGSFEYMELTTKDNTSMQSESESCSSNENLGSDVSKEDRAAPMYAVLDMNRKKEIHINDEIAIFDGSPIRRTKTLNSIDKDEATFSELDDTSYDESYDYDERSGSNSPDTVPWKEQCLSIQRWMLPTLSDNLDDEFVTLPDAIPVQEFEYCHYVPTLEAIMEEDEEGDESFEDLKQKFPKGALIDNADIYGSASDDVGWHSTNDLSECSTQSQDDLFSITSTCGSLGSMKRFNTVENLSFDEGQEESDGSSDEFDKVDGDAVREDFLSREIQDIAIMDNADANLNEAPPQLSIDLFPEEKGDAASSQLLSNPLSDVENEFVKLDGAHESDENTNHDEASPAHGRLEFLKAESDISSRSAASPCGLESSREAIAASSMQSLLGSDYASLSDETGSPYPDPEVDANEATSGSSALAMISPYLTPRESIEDIRDIQSEPILEAASSDMKLDDYEEPRSRSELDLSDIAPDLHFDAEDIPKIVVLFAQEELAKQRLKSDQTENGGDERVIKYRKRSATFDHDGFNDSAYSSREGIHRRINDLKSNDSSRMSALSSSTPELSVMTENALPYIPISYASEAAAKRKQKRRATMSSAEASSRRNAIRTLQSKAMIGGTGLGNGFNTLKKKLSRKSIGNSIRRSQSEKQAIYYSSPDVSNPVSRQLDSPRRRRPKAETAVPPKVSGRRRGFKSVVSNILRRLSVRFTSNNHTSSNDAKRTHDVIEEQPKQSNLLLIKEESSTTDSLSLSSNARESIATPSTSNDDVPQRRVSSALAAPNGIVSLEDFRERSQSVPLRPRSAPSPRKLNGGDSDVFESAQSIADDSLNETIYV